MKKIKILFVIRENALIIKGGDLIQLLRTKENIENQGHYCSVVYGTNELQKRVEEYDIIHIFNLQTPLTTLKAVNIAKKYNKKVVISTIFWDVPMLISNMILSKLGIKTFLKTENTQKSIYYLYKFLSFPFFKFSYIKNKYNDTILNPDIYNLILEIINKADLLLPNSELEIDKLCSFFKKDELEIRKKTKVVINGIDPFKFTNKNFKNNKKLEYFFKQIRIKNPQNTLVGEIGRIEERKNQISLVKALFYKEDISIIFIGNKNSTYGYFKKLEKISNKRGNVFFFDEISENDIPFAMKNLDVHILPSIFETPGLVSLEAAACGVPFISTKYSPFFEYFDKFGYSCDPFNLEKNLYENINYAIKMNSKERIEMKEYFLRNFSWKIASNQTLDAYNSIL